MLDAFQLQLQVIQCTLNIFTFQPNSNYVTVLKKKGFRVIESFISSEMLFQTNVHEYDKRFLNKLILGLIIRKFQLITDCIFKVVFVQNSQFKY